MPPNPSLYKEYRDLSGILRPIPAARLRSASPRSCSRTDRRLGRNAPPTLSSGPRQGLEVREPSPLVERQAAQKPNITRSEYAKSPRRGLSGPLKYFGNPSEYLPVSPLIGPFESTTTRAKPRGPETAPMARRTARTPPDHGNRRDRRSAPLRLSAAAGIRTDACRPPSCMSRLCIHNLACARSKSISNDCKSSPAQSSDVTSSTRERFDRAESAGTVKNRPSQYRAKPCASNIGSVWGSGVILK